MLRGRWRRRDPGPGSAREGARAAGVELGRRACTRLGERLESRGHVDPTSEDPVPLGADVTHADSHAEPQRKALLHRERVAHGVDGGRELSQEVVADAYDNARCESFFATLECELLDRRSLRTQAHDLSRVRPEIRGRNGVRNDRRSDPNARPSTETGQVQPRRRWCRARRASGSTVRAIPSRLGGHARRRSRRSGSFADGTRPRMGSAVAVPNECRRGWRERPAAAA